MQVSVQLGDGLKRELRVDLPAHEVEAEVDQRLVRFARSARVPGFRPGKAPARVLRAQYGEKVCSDVVRDLASQTFPNAVRQEQLQPAGLPVVELDIDPTARRYAYRASFEVYPTVELQPFAGTKLKRPVAQTSEDDVERLIERLREQRRVWKDVERGAQKGDQVRVSFTATIDGEPFGGGTAAQFPIEIGAGLMIPGFEDQLLGASAGEQRDFHLSFPDDYDAAHLAGREARFDVQILAVAEPVLPELNADFIREMGIESGELEAFHAGVRESMEREMQRRMKEMLRSRVLDALLAANPIEVPVVLVQQTAAAFHESFAKSAAAQQIQVQDQLFIDMARRRVATGLLVREAVKHYGLVVDDEAVRDRLDAIAAIHEKPGEVADRYSAERVDYVRSGLLEEMVVARLIEEADLEDEHLSLQEVMQSVE